jgi:cytochrome c oxidase cbb3-type subunit I/II
MELQKFTYDNRLSSLFLKATIFWGIVGMLVGLTIATELIWPTMTNGIQWLSFGRLRPLHTNAVIFAFVGNGMFTAIYYSTPRLLKTPMYSELLGKIHFWGWQLIIVAAAITLPLGITVSKV